MKMPFLVQWHIKGIVTTYAFDDKGNLQKAPITVYGFKAGVPVPLQ
jgi:branched-chain amino acid transport system substrate-binding protein